MYIFTIHLINEELSMRQPTYSAGLEIVGVRSQRRSGFQVMYYYLCTVKGKGISVFKYYYGKAHLENASPKANNW